MPAAAIVVLLLAVASADRVWAIDRPVQPDVLTPQMKEWLARKVPARAGELIQLKRLLQALQRDPDGPRLRYREGYTGTAQEAFETGAANCLSFSHVVVAMARELGVKAFYMDVKQIEQFSKEGDLVVVAGHMTAGFDEGIERRILEFSVGPDVEYRNAVRISDATAQAYYHSNRGAEQLQAGDVKAAIEWLQIATEIAPDLPDAWANLGVALRRNGQLREAEAAYRKAIELDADFFPGYQNLVALARFRGEPNAARQLLEVLERRASRNPFVYLAVGDLSMSHGDWISARDFYRKGWRLRRKSVELSSALGHAYLKLGDRRKAEKLLRKALREDPENPRARLLEKALGDEAAG